MTSPGDVEQPADPDVQDDYSYDLAHDEIPSSRRQQEPPRRRPPADLDTGGDYSYDLAHEIPPSPPR